MKLLQTTRSKFIVVGLAVLVAGSVGTYAYFNSNDKSLGTQEAEQAGDDFINLNPPTDEEKQAGDKQKASLEDQSRQNSESSQESGIKTVTPIITSWGQADGKVQVAARVPKVLEDGGTCTLTMVRAGKSVSATRKGVSNVSEVSCGYISIPSTKLSSGTWSASVSYSSPVAKGTSKTISINIQ